MHRYFAYGSNLHVAQMVARCPSARPLGAAYLPGHTLGFFGRSRGWDASGVANVRPVPEPPGGVHHEEAQDRVYGAIYELTEEDLHILDGYENMYQRERRHVYGAADGEAWVYVGLSDYGPNSPSPRYVAAMAYGYAEHGLPLDALQAALAAMGR